MKINDVLNEKKQPVLSKEDIQYYKSLILDSEFFKNNYNLIIDSEHGKVLNHGTDKDLGQATIIDITERKSSRDTDPIIHNLINELSEKELGIKLRNKLFVARDPSISSTYGLYIYKVIPLGNYEIYYSDNVKDLYTDLSLIIDKEHLGKQLSRKILNDLPKHENTDKISGLINFNFNKIISKHNDDFISDLSNIRPDDHIKIMKSKSSPNNIVNIIMEKLKNSIDEINDTIDYTDNEDDAILKALELFKIALRETIVNLNDELINLVSKHFKSELHNNYIKNIEKTKSVDDIGNYSEAVLNSEKALFLDSQLYANIIEEIILERGNED